LNQNSNAEGIPGAIQAKIIPLKRPQVILRTEPQNHLSPRSSQASSGDARVDSAPNINMVFDFRVGRCSSFTRFT
jgi:hypothetical protein